MLENRVVESILIIYKDRKIWQFALIIVDISINYKEQIVIIDINLGMQYFICQVSPQKRENLYKTWVLRTYKNMYAQIKLQDIDK